MKKKETKKLTFLEKFRDDFTQEPSNDKAGFTYFRDKGNKYAFAVYASPTFNCQNFSIASFDSLLRYVNEQKPSQEEFIQFLSEIADERKIVLIDVNEAYSETCKKLFEGYEVIVDQSYESTNLTAMHMFYIVIGERDECYPDDDEDYDSDDDDNF